MHLSSKDLFQKTTWLQAAKKGTVKGPVGLPKDLIDKINMACR